MRTSLFIFYLFTLTISLSGQIIELEPMTIQARQNRSEEASIPGTAVLLHKPLDLADVLAAELPQATIIRKGGTANDISLRGLSGDNLNVLNDARKIYGACMNRMDPPSAHASNEQVEKIEIVESVFDITRAGSLGGRINVITREPTAGWGARVAVTAGDFSYLSAAGEIQGGNEQFQFLGAYSYQESDPYKDGNGASLLSFPNNTIWPVDDYLDSYRDSKAFTTEKSQIKGNIVLAPSRLLKLSYSGERSEDVLYPGLRMDSEHNFTDQYAIRYVDTNAMALWDELTIDAYTNDVDHLMTDKRRKSSEQTPMGMKRPDYVLERGYYMTTHAFSGVDSIVFDASKAIDSSKLDYGVEWIRRNWDANNRLGAGMPNSGPGMEIFNEFVPDSTTYTLGGYAQLTQQLNDDWTARGGLRLDQFKSDASKEASFLKSQWGISQLRREHTEWSGFVLLEHQLRKGLFWYTGLGQTVRAPNAQELYSGLRRPGAMPNWIGNPNLNPVNNRELSLGFRKNDESWQIRGKVFLSYLDDYIYSTRLTPAEVPTLSKNTQTYTNLDARMLGLDFTATWFVNEHWTFSGGLAWQEGKKESYRPGALDQNLAEIPPLKGILSAAYAWENWKTSWSFQAAASQDQVDKSLGEFELAGYAVHNFNVKWQLNKQTSLSFSVDNVFDKAYAVNNAYTRNPFATYAVINEPGRWLYASIRWNY